jgi:hypothetical protein
MIRPGPFMEWRVRPPERRLSFVDAGGEATAGGVLRSRVICKTPGEFLAGRIDRGVAGGPGENWRNSYYLVCANMTTRTSQATCCEESFFSCRGSTLRDPKRLGKSNAFG